jgi:hypothetical protein
VDDPPAVGVLADDHTEVHGEGGAVVETEIDSKVAEPLRAEDFDELLTRHFARTTDLQGQY